MDLIDWTDSKYFILIPPTDEVTHNRGNILDLSFGKGSVSDLVEYILTGHLNVISDHVPLLTTNTSRKRKVAQ